MTNEIKFYFIVYVILVSIFFIFTALYAINKQKKLKKEIRKKKGVYVKWDEYSNFILAFISTHFKRSDKRLIHVLSVTLKRSESSLLRKISRLKGHTTGKGSNVTNIEAELMDTLSGTSIANSKYCKLLFNSLIECGLSDDELTVVSNVMAESTEFKKTLV